MMNEMVLVESKSMRDSYIQRIEVLNKVKQLTMLPDDFHVTVDMVADYYEVSINTVKSLIFDNNDELFEDGMRTLRGDELKNFVGSFEEPANSVSSKVRNLTLLPLRAVLRVGMLLTKSEVARQVRTHLLNIQEEHKTKSSTSQLHALQQTINALIEQEAKLNQVESDVANIKHIMNGFRKHHDELEAHEIAKKIGLLSQAGKPHKSMIFTIARQIGINTQLPVFEKQYEDNFVRVGLIVNNGVTSEKCYFKPTAVKRIIEWFEKNKTAIEWTELYKKGERAGTPNYHCYNIAGKTFKVNHLV